VLTEKKLSNDAENNTAVASVGSNDKQPFSGKIFPQRANKISLTNVKVLFIFPGFPVFQSLDHFMYKIKKDVKTIKAVIVRRTSCGTRCTC